MHNQIYRCSESEHKLQELAYHALSRHPFVAGRNLRIDLDQEDMVLSGVVGSYYHKQLAQESVREIAGTKRIRNDIEVISR